MKYIIENNNRVSKVHYKRSLKKKVLLFLFIIISIICIIFYSLKFFGITFLEQRQTISCQPYFLVVCQPESDELSSIHQEAQKIMLRGGGGNIIQQEQYYIALHAYSTLEKANEVVYNLSNQQLDATILTLTPIKYDITDYNETAKNIIQHNFNFILDTINSIYDLIANFDNENITENKLSNSLYKIKINCQQELQQLTNIDDFVNDIFYNQMLEVCSLMEALSNKNFDGNNLTSISCEFKNMYINLLLTICKI